MLDWIIKNKEWLFSGIGVVILTGIIGWIFRKRKKGESGKGTTEPTTYSVRQKHTGSGDNVGRDKNTKE